jgi:hypothetical protein
MIRILSPPLDEPMDMSDIVKLMDDAEALPKKRGPYKKKAA